MITRVPGRHRMTRKQARYFGPRGLKYAHETGQDLPITEVACQARMEGDGVGVTCSPPPSECGLDVGSPYGLHLVLSGLAVLTGISLLCTAAAASVVLTLWVPWG